jgi:hypothetical protein
MHLKEKNKLAFESGFAIKTQLDKINKTYNIKKTPQHHR